MHARSERGQFIVFFAVLVPLFTALMLFVVDAGKSYLENVTLETNIDALLRTIDAIVGTDGGRSMRLSSIPSDATSYETYDELSAAYVGSESVLDTLRTKVSEQAKLCGLDIDEESFAVEEASRDLYYRIVILRSSRDTRTMILKFDGDKNKITSVVTVEEADPSASGLELVKQYKAARSSTKKKNEIKTEFGAQYSAPTTPAEKATSLRVMGEVLSAMSNDEDDDVNDALEEFKSWVVKELLKSEAFTETERGKLLDAYLTSEVDSSKLNGTNDTTFKVNALIALRTYYDNAAQLAMIVRTLLENTPTVEMISSTESAAQYVMEYEDSAAVKRYHRITINANKIGHETW